jgi:sialic acid synthase SpsE
MVKIIAEIGMNHDGSIGQAKAFFKIAASCGVDAVKIQTHIADAETLLNAPRPKYFQDESRYEYFKRTAFNANQHLELKKYAESLNIEFISSPFSIEAIDLLIGIGVDTLKVPSGEVSNLPYLEYMSKFSKKVLLSTGMSSWAEIEEAFIALNKNGTQVTILQCTSEYPCAPEKAGLNNLKLFKDKFKCNVGFSDHTLGSAAAVIAITMGATVIEKHFTASNELYGPDAKFSANPDEMKKLVLDVRAAEKIINNATDKNFACSELGDMKITFEKSIVSARVILKDKVIEEDDLCYKKPGDGISAKEYKKIIGKKCIKNIDFNQKLSWSDFF